MNRERFDEVFTYVGKMPEPTPEEKERTKKLVKEMNEELELQLQRRDQGLKWDGTEYKEGEKEEMRRHLYEAYLRIPEEFRNSDCRKSV